MSEITLQEANTMVRTAIAKAEELGIKISVAVCDAGGRLVAFNKMDGAIWAGVYGSQGKAVASVSFARPSGEMQERADSPIVRGINQAEGGQDDRQRQQETDGDEMSEHSDTDGTKGCRIDGH